MHVAVGLCKQPDYMLVAAVAGPHYYISELLDMVRCRNQGSAVVVVGSSPNTPTPVTAVARNTHYSLVEKQNMSQEHAPKIATFVLLVFLRNPYLHNVSCRTPHSPGKAAGSNGAYPPHDRSCPEASDIVVCLDRAGLQRSQSNASLLPGGHWDS